MLTLQLWIHESELTYIPRLFSWVGIEYNDRAYEISFLRKTLCIYIDLERCQKVATLKREER